MAALKVLRGTANSALVPKYWSRKYLEDSFEKDPLKPFYGSIIATEYDLKKTKGDTIEVPIVGLLTGSGVTDDGNYDGDIGALPLYNMPVTIHEHGRAAGLNGKMTEKSAALRTRTLTMKGLTKWRAAFNARAVIDALSGLKLHTLGGNVLGASGLALDGNEAQIQCVTQIAPDYKHGNTAMRYYAGGQTAAQGAYNGRVADINKLNKTHYVFGTKVIEDVRRLAEKTVDGNGNLISPIERVKVNGRMLYVMLITQEQARDLKADPAWRTGHENVDVRGLENSIFSGALGVWDGVLLVETDLLHRRLGAGGITATEYFDSTTVTCATGEAVHRALFLGENAVAFALGEAPEYIEFYADHAKTKWAARVSSIYGVSKIAKHVSTDGAGALSTDTEVGCIVVDTAVVL
jgi:N4-gp56 family major capsid protein